MKKYYLVLILVLAAFFRLYALSSHPTGFTPDEASFGYDAYSILKTGADQWGVKFPLVLQSFGDGKMPLLSYLAIPSVFVFGLNEFAVRLPVVLVGIGAVYFTYLLTKRAFNQENLSLMAAFLLAVSPWHIAMSRGAFEASLTTFFLTAGIYFFLNLKASRKAAFLSSLLFGMNLFSYHSARFVTPLVIVFLMAWQFGNKDWRAHLKNRNLQIFIFVTAIFFGLSFLSMFMGAGARLSTSTILDMSPPADARFNDILAGMPPLMARFFNNRYLLVGKVFVDQYLQYFSPQFWFSQGPMEGTYGMLPGFGVLYLIELVFIFGIFLNPKKLRQAPWVVVWLLVAPIPAALSRGPGYAANRATVMLPALLIILSLGWNNIKTFLNKKSSLLFSKTIIVVYLISIVIFSEKYFIQQKYEQADAMLYGSRELFNYLENNEADFRQIVVSKSLSEAHIYLAFYNKINPTTYQEATKNFNYKDLGLNWVDQMPEYAVGKYLFTTLDYQKYKIHPDLLMVGRPEEFPSGATLVKVIKYPDLTDAFWIVSTNTMPFAQK